MHVAYKKKKLPISQLLYHVSQVRNNANNKLYTM